ncbi:MAG: transketolase [Deltaproteobacteria bacterium CG2_30_63_29]|nr:MAG: transketolase [Deltaproteobacteria bacterium CG2_30_63_29]PIW00230.1 MAG: transketolase [Deltaproteobacteria bacterium CG17_big_fil_post_rev_8_21_14_2_50_63_7]PJB40468.1 MAG: transketolase [Deltaproteobacteria bacterium CG_4_9_14_3_um_filter_63_12]
MGSFVEWLPNVKRIARGIRLRVLRHTLQHGGGYLSQGCSSAELLALLYGDLLNLGPSCGPLVPPKFSAVPGASTAATHGWVYNGPRDPELARFFFSPVHYSLALYAALIEVRRLGEDALDGFDEDGSTVEMIGAEHSPGIEVTAGSLGQCLSQALGVAMARRRRGESGTNWVFMSDGEFQEGQTWEAFAAAHYHGVDNLRVIVDVNGQQCDGDMASVMSIEPLAARLEAFGSSVREVDGHDLVALRRAAMSGVAGRVRVILARTDACRGVELLRSRAPNLHYLRFKSDDEKAAYAALLRQMEAES